MKNPKALNQATLLGIGLVLLLSACSGGGGSSASSSSTTPTASVTIVGSVGGGYTVASVDSFLTRFLALLENRAYALVGVNVNTIVALRAESGDLTQTSVINSVSTSINPDGTFSLSLDKNYDWVLLLMDKNATGTSRFIGTVALNANNTDSLLNLPTSSASTSSIALGAINDAGNNVGLSTGMANTTDFSLSAAQLLTLAKTDDIYKNAKNLVLNYNKATGVYYTLRPDFKWRGTYAGLNTTASDPLTYAYNHYNFQLDSNATDVAKVIDLCGVPPVTSLKLFPPLGASAVSVTPALVYNDMTPITNDAAICSNVTNNGAVSAEASEFATGGDFFASGAYTNISYSFGGTIGGAIPTGYWRYSVNDVLKAQFDVSAVAPLALNGVAIKGFAPSIKVNTDGNNKVTSVDITWYVVSADGLTKTPLAPVELALLKHAVAKGGIFFDNSTTGTRRYESVNFDPATQTSITPVSTWYYNATPASAAVTELATGIGIFYSSAGMGYFIEFFYP